MKVICVLKTGGEFLPQHVLRLGNQFCVHAPESADFVCLTDDPGLDDLRMKMPLEHRWPGWWSKVESFKIPGPAILLDLDVSIVSDMSRMMDIAREIPLTMCRGFWGADDPSPINSSVVAWSGDASALYHDFAANAGAYIADYRFRNKWGDQAWIRDHWRGDIALWQDVLPGAVVSFKRDFLLGRSIEGACIVASHGQPRPWHPKGADAMLGGVMIDADTG
jgi:hypothetical protein